MPGTLYLIPVPLAPAALHTLPAEVYSVTLQVQHFFVENARTARRFLREMHPLLPIEPLHLYEIDKHAGADTVQLKALLAANEAVGVMSEAGCPGIADPGSELVAVAHQLNAVVKPLTGPSSILLALMASGFNGQRFSFEGYLPLKDPARSSRIKALENISRKEHATQIFIETPYRNDALLNDLIQHCAPSTKLCIARNITAEDAFIKTASLAEWKRLEYKPGKAPAIFVMLA